MGPRIDRRRALALAGGAVLAACDRKGDAPASSSTAHATASAPAHPESGDWRALDFPKGEGTPEGQRALLFTPEGARDLPVLIALHGRGESGRGLDVGARGWRDDYGLELVHRRLRQPPLAARDVGELITDERLARINASLAAHAYRGLAVACPYTPDLPDRTIPGAAGFARFLLDGLLPRVRAEAGAGLDRAATGIDGVSMGGRLALFVGLANPQVFGAVGALQPALRIDEAEIVAMHARAAMTVAPIALRLVSSDEDPFLPAVRALAARLKADGVPHELVVTPGPHDYIWNRGPGAAEMLVWHDRVLRGLAPP
ncbi:MAG: alpha/beta hydrolase-fold protein [Polyangiaceae bacterium]